jgi:hypothetical protein
MNGRSRARPPLFIGVDEAFAWAMATSAKRRIQS